MIHAVFLLSLPLLSALAPGSQDDSAARIARVQRKAAQLAPDLIELRRDIHMHPELSGAERRTAARVAQELEALGLEVTTGVGGHGVVGLLRGGRPGPVIAYRADMDAVRSPVVGDPPYRSQVPGVKHVCGHDAHVAIGIGVAQVLASMRAELPGTVKFLFQPAEENAQGASAMIKDGALAAPKPEVIFGLHTTPFPVGTIGCPLGVGLAGLEPFQLRIRAGDLVQEVARDLFTDLMELSTVTPPASGAAFQRLLAEITVQDGPYRDFVYIFPPSSAPGAAGELVLSGGVRAFDDEGYARTRASIEELVAAYAEDDEIECELTFSAQRLPNMHNDVGLVRAAMPVIEATLGEGSAVPVYATIPFFGEDFSYYQQHIPGAMFFLGVANDEIGAFNHMPDYDLDESAIELGTAVMANVLLEHLRRR